MEKCVAIGEIGKKRVGCKSWQFTSRNNKCRQFQIFYLSSSVLCY